MGNARPRSPRATLAAAAVVALLVALITAPSAAAEGQVFGADRADAVRDSYIVSIKDTASPKSASAQTAGALTKQYGGQVRRSWQHALNGFSAHMTAQQARRIAADPRVAFVQQDAVVKASGTQNDPPSWGLDRIDQRDLPLDHTYSYGTSAKNVHAYVIDTGIRTTHVTFGGRATWGTNTVDNNDTDCFGHGTHVAGTIGGSQYGVAKNVRLVAVKVLDCSGSGTTEQVVNGINWVTEHAVKPAVANMSLGGPADPALDAAVANSIDSGVTYAVAAGNANADACSVSPARVRAAITVGAADADDHRASFSDYGKCTSIFAPGVKITSAWHSDDNAVNTISGTSMATPHVAGVAALWLSAHPGDSPEEVRDALVEAATADRVVDAGIGSPNRMLFSRCHNCD
jgi:subtilisin family serine protease